MPCGVFTSIILQFEYGILNMMVYRIQQPSFIELFTYRVIVSDEKNPILSVEKIHYHCTLNFESCLCLHCDFLQRVSVVNPVYRVCIQEHQK